MSRLYGLGHNRVKAGITQNLPRQVHPVCPPTNKAYATYHVDKVNPQVSSHELAEKDPILGQKGFQHPAFGRNTCIIPDCEHKLCNQLCAPIKEKVHVGHGTHDGSREDSKFVSTTDLNGAPRPQYMKSYSQPVHNTDASEINIDSKKTTELNNNTEMKDNVHLYSSRNPAQPLNTGSNDPTNIN